MSLVDSSSIPTWRTLTQGINAMQSPLSFLRGLLRGEERLLMTEDIEYGILTRGRTMAPFTKPFAEGVMIGGWSDSTRIVRAPNIRVKRPFSPVNMFQRRAGTVVFANGEGGPAAGMAESILECRSRDMLALETDIQNTEEYMLAMFLQGGLTYSDAATDAFAISLGRSGSNSITPSVYWDDATLANIDILADLHSIKRLANASATAPVTITDAICGTSAASTFLALAKRGGIPGFSNATAINPYIVGTVDMTKQFNEQGVIWLGRVAGIDFWEYGRSATLNGASVDMIRAKYIEFVSRDNNASGRSFVYAPIPDVKTLKSGNLAAKRLAKSWEEEDPSVEMLLVASRPMPLWQRPDSTYSFKAVT